MSHVRTHVTHVIHPSMHPFKHWNTHQYKHIYIYTLLCTHQIPMSHGPFNNSNHSCYMRIRPIQTLTYISIYENIHPFMYPPDSNVTHIMSHVTYKNSCHTCHTSFHGPIHFCNLCHESWVMTPDMPHSCSIIYNHSSELIHAWHAVSCIITHHILHTYLYTSFCVSTTPHSNVTYNESFPI